MKDEAHTLHPPRQVKAVMDALAETILDETAEEIKAECYLEGVDPVDEAEDVRQVLLSAVEALENKQQDDCNLQEEPGHVAHRIGADR